MSKIMMWISYRWVVMRMWSIKKCKRWRNGRCVGGRRFWSRRIWCRLRDWNLVNNRSRWGEPISNNDYIFRSGSMFESLIWEYSFNKGNMSSGIYAIGSRIKCIISTLGWRIFNVNTSFWPGIKFVGGVWFDPRVTKTSKTTEFIMVGEFFEETKIRRFVV